ncbi:hypothetical protein L7F22_049103 [Adiantum nelumboides]|nr:hypothetical protein [Adiantum nelumboides]
MSPGDYLYIPSNYLYSYPYIISGPMPFKGGGSTVNFDTFFGVKIVGRHFNSNSSLMWSLTRIIGRIAFTNKHQWVFSSNDKGFVTDGGSTKKANSRAQPEKYPSGWDQQFAAGIKTIAVIAVPQGVVQLGSTRVIAEDLKLIGHVKALFGTLQNVPGAFLSDFVTEVQRGGVHTPYPMAVPAPQLSLTRTPSLPKTLATRTASPAASTNLSAPGVGRLPRNLAAQQQILTHAHSMPTPSALGLSGGVSYFQHLPCDNSALESFSNPSICTLQRSCTSAGSEDVRPLKMATTTGVKPSTHISAASGMNINTPQTGVIQQRPLSSKASAVAISAATSSPFSQAVYSPCSTDSSVTVGKGVNVVEPDQFRFNPPPPAGVIRHLSLNSKASTTLLPAATAAPFLQAVHSLYSVNSDCMGGKGDVEDFEQPKVTPLPQTGIIRNLSLNSKASRVATPAVTGAPSTQPVHSAYSVHSITGVGKNMNVKDSEKIKIKRNPPLRTGVIRHLSLSSNVSPIVILDASDGPVSQVNSPNAVVGDKDAQKSGGKYPPQIGGTRHLSPTSQDSPIGVHSAAGAPFHGTFHSPCSVSSAATRGNGVNLPSVAQSEQSRAPGKSTFRAESPWPVCRKQMILATERGEVDSFVDSSNTSVSTARGHCLTSVGGTWSQKTQSMTPGTSPVKQMLGDVRVSAEQSGGRSFQSGQKLSMEGLQSDSSSRRSEINQQQDSRRCLIESEPMRNIQTLMEVQQLDHCSTRLVHSAQLAPSPVGKELAKGLDRPLPPAEISSLVERRAIESNELSEHCQLQDVSYSGKNKMCQFESSEPGESNLLPSSNASVIGGFPSSVSWNTMKQDSHEERKPIVKLSSSPCKEITSESSYLTVQMSDLLELAQQFEYADSEGQKDLNSVNVDSPQVFLSNLFDDYIESLQSLKPIFQSPHQPVGDSGQTDYSVQNLFNNELDDFDEFFASLDKIEEGKSGLSAQPEAVSGTRSNSEVSGYLIGDSYNNTSKGEENFINIIIGSKTALCPAPSATDRPDLDCSAYGATLQRKEKDLQTGRFVNSRYYPELLLPQEGNTVVSCKEMAALPRPRSRQCEIRKKGRKRRWSIEGDSTLQLKGRQKMQERIQELRAIVPDGAKGGIDTLLERALEYASALQRLSQDSCKGPSSTNLQIPEGGIGTAFDASWVIDTGAHETACPVLVESLSQPGQMLVEMLCQEHAIFLKIADVVKSLGFTILKGVMEARSNSIWARFMIEGPQEIHRVEVLWPLLHLLGASTVS